VKKGKDIEDFNFLQNALMFDPEKHQLSAAKADWLLMRGGMFRDILIGINNMSGSLGSITLEKIGKYVGKGFFDAMNKKGIDKKEIPTILDLFINQGGWGKADITVDNQKRTAVIKIENSVTTRCTQGKENICVFLQGYLEGVFEGIFDTKVICIEKNCINKGDDACTFHVNC
jgi:predicted hydrocarbon binding protein